MTAPRCPQSSAIKALQKELNELIEAPVEGFSVTLEDDSNLFFWDVTIFGPPQTLYEGGYFKARLIFPGDYPYNPPSMVFMTKMFHPNIFENGSVCISILHAPGEDMYSDELPSERWNPTQNVRTILLSVISLLNEPNIHSAAHVDASVAYRRWIESGGKDKTYEMLVKSLVDLSKSDAIRDGVSVPTTLEDYCMASRLIRERTEDETKLMLDEGDEYYFGTEESDDGYDDEGDGDDEYGHSSETTTQSPGTSLDKNSVLLSRKSDLTLLNKVKLSTNTAS